MVTKINMGLFPNISTNYLAPHLILLLLYMMICMHKLVMTSCDCALHLVFVLFICSSMIVWVSIDFGVEVTPTYPDEQYYTPRQQGKR